MIRYTESTRAGWKADRSRNTARLWNVAGNWDEGYRTGHRRTGQSSRTPVDFSAGGSNGHQENRNGADSRIDGVAKLEDGLMDITYLDYADN